MNQSRIKEAMLRSLANSSVVLSLTGLLSSKGQVEYSSWEYLERTTKNLAQIATAVAIIMEAF